MALFSAFRLQAGTLQPYARVLSAAAKSVPIVPLGAEVLLFSHKICPYCCKTTALLKHLGVPFEEQEVSPLTKSQLKWLPDYKKVPVAVFSDGDVVKDSAIIADKLLQQYGVDDRGESFASAGAREWAIWSTAKLAVYMYPNMTRSFAESRATLSYFGGMFGSSGGPASPPPGIAQWDAALTQTLGALGMTLAHGKVKQKYGIDDERAALWGALGEWEAELERAARDTADGKERGPFRGGAAPDFGDVSVYGVLCAARGVPLFEEISAGGAGTGESGEAASPQAALGRWMVAMEGTMA